MATNFLWGNVGAVVALLASELDSLASGSGTAYGPEVGGANNPQLGMLSLHLASNSLNFTTTSSVSVFFVPSKTTVAGAAYPTYTSGASFKLATQNYLAGVIYINPTLQVANVVDEVLPNVIIPLGAFKTILVSNLGVTMPAAGNTLSLYPTPTQY